jgi:hypothetical protein
VSWYDLDAGPRVWYDHGEDTDTWLLMLHQHTRLNVSPCGAGEPSRRRIMHAIQQWVCCLTRKAGMPEVQLALVSADGRHRSNSVSQSSDQRVNRWSYSLHKRNGWLWAMALESESKQHHRHVHSKSKPQSVKIKACRNAIMPGILGQIGLPAWIPIVPRSHLLWALCKGQNKTRGGGGPDEKIVLHE